MYKPQSLIYWIQFDIDRIHGKSKIGVKFLQKQKSDGALSFRSWILSNIGHSFNSKNLFVFMCLLQMITSSLSYSLFEAKSIGEFANSLFICLIDFAWIIQFSSNIFKISNILALIGEFEKFIGKSKSKVYTIENCRYDRFD